MWLGYYFWIDEEEEWIDDVLENLEKKNYSSIEELVYNCTPPSANCCYYFDCSLRYETYRWGVEKVSKAIEKKQAKE